MREPNPEPVSPPQASKTMKPCKPVQISASFPKWWTVGLRLDVFSQSIERRSNMDWPNPEPASPPYLLREEQTSAMACPHRGANCETAQLHDCVSWSLTTLITLITLNINLNSNLNWKFGFYICIKCKIYVTVVLSQVNQQIKRV